MPSSQAGVAAAIASTSCQVGITLGVATLGAVAGANVASAHSLGGAFASSTRPAWWVLVGVVSGVLVLGAITTTSWADATARRTAERLAEPVA